MVREPLVSPGQTEDLFMGQENNGNSRNTDLERYLDRRSEHLEKVYQNTWTPNEVEELRRKTKAATDRARKIRNDWNLT